MLEVEDSRVEKTVDFEAGRGPAACGSGSSRLRAQVPALWGDPDHQEGGRARWTTDLKAPTDSQTNITGY